MEAGPVRAAEADWKPSKNDLNHTFSAKRARRRVSRGRRGIRQARYFCSVWFTRIEGVTERAGSTWSRENLVADQRLEPESELGLARSPFRSHEVARLKQKGVPTLIETPKPQQPIHPTLHQHIDWFFCQFNLGAQVFGCCIRVIIQRLLGSRGTWIRSEVRI